MPCVFLFVRFCSFFSLLFWFTPCAVSEFSSQEVQRSFPLVFNTLPPLQCAPHCMQIITRSGLRVSAGAVIQQTTVLYSQTRTESTLADKCPEDLEYGTHRSGSLNPCTICTCAQAFYVQKRSDTRLSNQVSLPFVCSVPSDRHRKTAVFQLFTVLPAAVLNHSVVLFSAGFISCWTQHPCS